MIDFSNYIEKLAMVMHWLKEINPGKDDKYYDDESTNALHALFVAQTYPTVYMFYEALKNEIPYKVDKLSDNDITYYLIPRINRDDRRIDYISNNHTIQLSERFCETGKKRISEVKELSYEVVK